MIRTWDIFDTLIARRCIFPQVIFYLVEETSHFKYFTSARIEAERNAAKRGNYNFDDIYEEFQKLTNAPKDVCDNLKKLEADAEIAQAIPITENLLQVQAGDVLITDMYLPEPLIRRMLSKVGLLEPVEVFISSGGKSSGRIWTQLAEQKEFVFHVGDNQESDINNSRRAGFESTLSVLSESITTLCK